jgi:hypothetical protein
MNPTAEILNRLLEQAMKPGFTVDPVTKEAVGVIDVSPGFLQVMGRKDRRSVQTDIPAAFEMYTLLQHFLELLPLTEICLSEDLPEIELTPGIRYDSEHKRLVLLIDCKADELPYVAHYVADRIPSSQLKARPGTLALAYSIERHGEPGREAEHLIPEWHAAWYVNHDPGHCIPVLALQSVLHDEHFSGDWVDVALHRMGVFRLPRAKAIEALRTRTKE